MLNCWSGCENLAVVLSYHNEERYAHFRKALDVMLNDSAVQELWIVVVLPSGVKKEELPQHNLISYIGPKDISWYGKLRDETILSRLNKVRDVALWFEMSAKKSMHILSKMPAKTVVAVGVPLMDAHIHITPSSDDPTEIVTFVKQTLQKINKYE